MEKKVLLIDNPYFAEPFELGIKNRLNLSTLMTLDLGLAKKLIENDECGLVIAEPMEIMSPFGISALTPILEQAMTKKVKVIIRSTLPRDRILKRCGIEPSLYNLFLDKSGDIDRFYDIVDDMFHQTYSH